MEEQFLLFGDKCYTIISKSSIVLNENEEVELVCGSEIKYLWPEGALHRKTYKGKIIAISSKYEVRKFLKI